MAVFKLPWVLKLQPCRDLVRRCGDVGGGNRARSAEGANGRFGWGERARL